MTRRRSTATHATVAPRSGAVTRRWSVTRPKGSSYMTSISDRERQEIEAANASGDTPVVFIHGLWVLPSSWANWADFFKQAGYAPLTPDWPDDPATVDAARANPNVLAKKTLKQIADHTTEIIDALDKKPVVMGHSTGGLVGADARGPGSVGGHGGDRPRGLPRRPASAALRAQGGGSVPDQPTHTLPRDHAHAQAVQVRLGECVGRGRGEGALRDVPRRRLRDRSRADGQREPQPVDAGEGRTPRTPTAVRC